MRAVPEKARCLCRANMSRTASIVSASPGCLSSRMRAMCAMRSAIPHKYWGLPITAGPGLDLLARKLRPGIET